MDVVFGLIGVTIVLLVIIAMVMLWAIRSGQFEDLEGPAWRVLMDDDRADLKAGDGDRRRNSVSADPDMPIQPTATNDSRDTPKT